MISIFSLKAGAAQGNRKITGPSENPTFPGCVFYCSNPFWFQRTILSVVVGFKSGMTPILRLP